MIDQDDVITWEPGLRLVRQQKYIIGALVFYFEYLAGDLRKGIGKDGNEWEVKLKHHYGHIVDTVGGDGEELDFFMRPRYGRTRSGAIVAIASAINANATTYVVDQINLETNLWDEHKLLIGYKDQEQAQLAYNAAFSDQKGPARLGAIVCLPFDTLAHWVYVGDTASAISSQTIEGMAVTTTERGKATIADNQHNVQLPTQPLRHGAVSISLKPQGSFSLHDRSTPGQIRYAVYVLGRIDCSVEYQLVYNDIIRLLKTAPESAQFDFYIASCGGDLLSAVRIASAMCSSRAHITSFAIGEVCSAAVSIWAEGKNRIIANNAYFMQHMSSHMDYGLSTNITQRAATISYYIRNVILKRQVDIKLLTEEEASSIADRGEDVYISAKDAIARGAAP